MLSRVGLVVLVSALVCPAAALGGGFATVGLQSQPEGIDPGEPWMAEFTVLQHGRTPFLDGRPQVTVHSADGSIAGSFPARLVNKTGLYRARVVFPESGRFEYVIDDGFSQRHTFPPVTVGAGEGDPAPVRRPRGLAAAPGGDGSSVPLALVLAAAAGAPHGLGRADADGSQARRRRRAGDRRVRPRARSAPGRRRPRGGGRDVRRASCSVDGGDERGSAPAARAEAVPAGGRALFLEMGCGSCHRFADAGSTGTIGPDLDERLASHDRASLSATIVSPAGVGGTAFTVMPDNFGERMDARELDALVGYLLAARQSLSRGASPAGPAYVRHARRPSCRPRAC